MPDRDYVERRVKRQVKRYGPQIGFDEMEEIMQKYAEVCRRMKDPQVSGADMEGWWDEA